MRVVLNQTSLQGARTGIGHYTSQLLRQLPQFLEDVQLDLFPPPWLFGGYCLAADLFRRLKPRDGDKPPATPGPQDTTRPVPANPAPAAGKMSLNQLVRVLRERSFQWLHRRCDLYHEPNIVPLPLDRPTLATVHDLSVLLHPEWHPASRVVHFERAFRRGLAQCQHFLAISEFGKQELVRHLGIPPERITVTYMGVRDGLAPLPRAVVLPTLQRLGLPERYLLHVGTLEPRKNLLTLLQAYCDLPASQRQGCPLVLVGSWGWNHAEIAHYLNDQARHRQVIHVGYAPDECLPALYSGARALVAPSFYEGFGLPPLEMLACGGAVLASTADAHVEVVGPSAHLIDPRDRDGWRQAMSHVISDDDWQASLCRHATETARKFTWADCAARTAETYHRLLGRRPQDQPGTAAA